jgi:hypothetical protein
LRYNDNESFRFRYDVDGEERFPSRFFARCRCCVVMQMCKWMVASIVLTTSISFGTQGQCDCMLSYWLFSMLLIVVSKYVHLMRVLRIKALRIDCSYLVIDYCHGVSCFTCLVPSSSICGNTWVKLMTAWNQEVDRCSKHWTSGHFGDFMLSLILVNRKQHIFTECLFVLTLDSRFQCTILCDWEAE